MEAGVNKEFAQAYGGCSLAIENPVTPDQCSDFYWDLVLLYRSLAAVTNNAQDNIGVNWNGQYPTHTHTQSTAMFATVFLSFNFPSPRLLSVVPT